MFNRITVIQRFINSINAQLYLEVGSSYGECFLEIKAPTKIAVDPNTKINWIRRIFYKIGNISNISSKYITKTSDQFFIQENKKLVNNGLDVVFIDGLHTFQQSYKDVENTLKYLNQKGVIIVHDCNPKNETSAIPCTSLEEVNKLNLEGWTNEWCGDVWKTIVRLRSERNDLNIFVLDCDYGLGVITRGSPDNNLDLTISEIQNLTYYDLDKDRENILNLKSVNYLESFLSNYKI